MISFVIKIIKFSQRLCENMFGFINVLFLEYRKSKVLLATKTINYNNQFIQNLYEKNNMIK